MPDVRSIFIKLLLSLATLPLIAADLPPMTEGARIDPMIDFYQEIVTHSGRRWIDETCRAGKKVFGCTDFPDELLFCNCVPDGENWKIEIRGRIRAQTHIRTGDNATLLHEMRHIQDLRQALADHLAQALAVEYPSEKVCRIRANVMSSRSYMHDVMNRLRLDSNRKFGCS